MHALLNGMGPEPTWAQKSGLFFGEATSSRFDLEGGQAMVPHRSGSGGGLRVTSGRDTSHPMGVLSTNSLRMAVQVSKLLTANGGDDQGADRNLWGDA